MNNLIGEWVAIEKWCECQDMGRQGFVFEIQNAAGQSLFTACGPLLPLPFDWSAAPIRFRLIREPAPERSTPIPPPRR